eukprot:3881816-Prymnesium_polylepis.1
MSGWDVLEGKNTRIGARVIENAKLRQPPGGDMCVRAGRGREKSTEKEQIVKSQSTDGVKSGQGSAQVGCEKASPDRAVRWARCMRWRLRPVRSPTWLLWVPAASFRRAL